MLNKMAASLEARRAEFAKLETLDCGKPIAESDADIDFCIQILKFVKSTRSRCAVCCVLRAARSRLSLQSLLILSNRKLSTTSVLRESKLPARHARGA